jgi:hypothetical protein
MVLYRCLGALLLFTCVTLGPLRAEERMHDASLPTVAPNALQQLSDTRIRQQIMRQSQLAYRARCVCPYQVKDALGRSCHGRHETVSTGPRPICYPKQVTQKMIDDWKNHQRE